MTTLLPQQTTLVGLEVPLKNLKPVTVFQNPEENEVRLLVVEKDHTRYVFTVEGHFITLDDTDTIFHRNRTIEYRRRFCHRCTNHAEQK